MGGGGEGETDLIREPAKVVPTFVLATSAAMTFNQKKNQPVVSNDDGRRVRHAADFQPSQGSLEFSVAPLGCVIPCVL
jgi:hypothetical protein